MHRAVLQVCWPWFVCLLVAGGVAALLVQFCGGRWQWRRWRELHSDQGGAVQSLSLVLTLPIFILLVLFIVQISQMMVAVMMVHYSAFAAARAAAVWIPAEVTNEPTLYDDLTNIDLTNVPFLPRERSNVIAGLVQPDPLRPGILQLQPGIGTSMQSIKYQKIALAAVIPCLTISPSRDFHWETQMPVELQPTYNTLLKLYPQFDPASRSNLRMPKRLMNKLIYSEQFTNVTVEWQEVNHPTTDVDTSPTYNPRNHPLSMTGRVPHWNRNEVGFRDPVTVRVSHQFALLPGIGRILKTGLVFANGNWENKNQDDAVASKITKQTRINVWQSSQAEWVDPDGTGGGAHAHGEVSSRPQLDELYTINITAEATFVNEGYKSLLRLAVHP